MAETPIQIRNGSLKLVEYPFSYREDDLIIVKTITNWKDTTQILFTLEIITNVLVISAEETVIRSKSATLPPEANAQSKVVPLENRFYPMLITGVNPFYTKGDPTQAPQGKFEFYLAPELLLESYREILKSVNAKNGRVDAILSSNQDNSNGKVNYYIGKITEYR